MTLTGQAVSPGKCEISGQIAPWASSLRVNTTPGSNQPGQVHESEDGVAQSTQKKSDRINSGFELSGGFFTLLHITRIIHDQSVAGVSPVTVAFFTLWGYWNLYYYKSIQQRWSLVASYFITLTNTVWLILLLYYSLKGA